MVFTQPKPGPKPPVPMPARGPFLVGSNILPHLRPCSLCRFYYGVK